MEINMLPVLVNNSRHSCSSLTVGLSSNVRSLVGQIVDVKNRPLYFGSKSSSWRSAARMAGSSKESNKVNPLPKPPRIFEYNSKVDDLHDMQNTPAPPPRKNKIKKAEQANTNPFDGDDDVVATTGNPFDDVPNNSFNADEQPTVHTSGITETAPVDMASNGDISVLKKHFLSLLTQYLRINSQGNTLSENTEQADFRLTQDGLLVVNKNHVKKMQSDIKENQVLSENLSLHRGLKNAWVLDWVNRGPETHADLQKILDAFRHCHHPTKSSFYNHVLNKFDFFPAGLSPISPAENRKVIEQVSRQPIQVNLKAKNDKTEMLQDISGYLLDSANYKKPIPPSMLDKVITYYSREEQQLEKAREEAHDASRETCAKLNDQGFIDRLKRYFHQANTDGRIERYNNNLDSDIEEYQKAWTAQVDKFICNYNSDAIKEKITNKCITKLQGDVEEVYGEIAPGTPNPVRDLFHTQKASISYIEEQVIKKRDIIISEVTSIYLKSFTEKLIETVESFSASNFFEHKSIENMAENVDKINSAFISTDKIYTRFYESLKQGLEKRELPVSMLDKEYRNYQSGLRLAISEKLVENDLNIVKSFRTAVDKVGNEPLMSDSDQKARAEKLALLAENVAKSIKTISKRNWPEVMSAGKSEMIDKLRQQIDTLKDEIKSKQPERKTRFWTFIDGMKKALPFGAIGLAATGGLLLFPVIGVPLAIIAGLGSVGWAVKRVKEAFKHQEYLKFYDEQVVNTFKQMDFGVVVDHKTRTPS